MDTTKLREIHAWWPQPLYEGHNKTILALCDEVDKLRRLLPPEAERGPWPSSATWSVFAEKMQRERDEAREEVERLTAEVERLRGPHWEDLTPGNALALAARRGDEIAHAHDALDEAGEPRDDGVDHLSLASRIRNLAFDLTEARDLLARERDGHERDFAELAALRERVAKAETMLARVVKYCREDRAVTPGFTRLARLCDEIVVILAALNPPPAAEAKAETCWTCNETGRMPCALCPDFNNGCRASHPPDDCPPCPACGRKGVR